MADLAGHEAVPAVQFPANQYRRANSRACGDKHTCVMPASGATPVLADKREVGVVDGQNGRIEPAFQDVAHGDVAPARKRGGGYEESRSFVDHTWQGNHNAQQGFPTEADVCEDAVNFLNDFGQLFTGLARGARRERAGSDEIQPEIRDRYPGMGRAQLNVHDEPVSRVEFRQGRPAPGARSAAHCSQQIVLNQFGHEASDRWYRQLRVRGQISPRKRLGTGDGSVENPIEVRDPDFNRV
jgi:hypothetical protein